MNNVCLVGNLTRDPDLKYASTGTALMNSNIAVKRQFKNQKGEYESDFINLKAFGKAAELFANSFKKGSKVALTGTIQTGKYENKLGQTVYTSDVIVNSITFIEPKNSNTSQQPQPTETTSGGFDIEDKDLPF